MIRTARGVVRADPHFFTRKHIQRFVPAKRAGAYALGVLSGSKFVVGYVGRSDACLRHRLLWHELLGEFDVFLVRTANDPAEAFQFECAFWHRFTDVDETILNRIHPASPPRARLMCPYCGFASNMLKLMTAE